MFLSTMPLWLSGSILVGMTRLVAMSGPALIRRRSSEALHFVLDEFGEPKHP